MAIALVVLGVANALAIRLGSWRPATGMSRHK
jgi:hypothetical protein